MSVVESPRKVEPLSNRAWAVSLGLVLLTYLTFIPVLHCGYTDFDDPEYVTNNQPVLDGLNLKDVKWAWTTTHAGYWQPLSWLSLMLDSTISGSDPHGFHRTNLLLHAFSAGVVFLVVSRLTGTLWRAALVAALYAVHPLRVESVAWVAERKDVLSNLFAWLTIGGYVAYSRRPNPRRYLLVLIPFVLGLLSKPMIATLPCLLLLLDYWPLRRWGWNESADQPFAPATKSRLILEKLPLLALAFVAGAAAVRSQSKVGAMLPLAVYPMSHRIPAMLIGYGLYLWKMVWYAGLMVFYPLPNSWVQQSWPWTRWAMVAGSAATLLALTGLCVFQHRRRPWLIVGWLWFIGVMLPVSGVFQAGPQLLADRFSYLPCVGLLMMIVWSIPVQLHARRRLVFLGGISAGVVLMLGVATWIQCGYWQGTRTLFGRALAVNEDNWLAHDQVSLCLYRDGNYKGAVAECARAIQLNPCDPVGNLNMGIALAKDGKDAEAIPHFRMTLSLLPDRAQAHAALGASLQRTGKLQDAYVEFRTALDLQPNDWQAHSDLGGLLAQIGLYDQAIAEFKTALRLNPKDENARLKLQYAESEKRNQKKKIQSVADTGNK